MTLHAFVLENSALVTGRELLLEFVQVWTQLNPTSIIFLHAPLHAGTIWLVGASSIAGQGHGSEKSSWFVVGMAPSSHGTQSKYDATVVTTGTK